MTALDEYLKKQEIEVGHELKYILRHDETPNDEQLGMLLRRFHDESDPDNHDLECWLKNEETEELFLIFYASPRCKRVYEPEELISTHQEVLNCYNGKIDAERALEVIYEQHEIH